MNNVYDYCVVSSRVRLARNLTDYPFGVGNSGGNFGGGNEEIINNVARTLKPLGEFYLTRMSELDPETAAYLKEKYIISPYLAKNTATGAVIISDDEKFSVMINEEDHLREQCVLEGLSLFEAYDNLKFLDRKLSERMKFAVDEDFGYITACMTNLGTGMRASAMLFLPALTKADKMPGLISEMKDLGLTVRGVLGEGSRADGCLYQVSNEVTLGYSEEEILKMVEFASKKLCDLELAERNCVYALKPLETEDACRRAYGILTNCKLLGYDEFAELYVKVFLGAYYGFLNLSPQTLNKLFVNMRPAVLTYIEKAETAEARDAVRAEIVAGVLSGRY